MLAAVAQTTDMTPGRIAAMIVCHDLGRTISEALESVERQTRQAAEVVVIDAASTDIYTRQVLSRISRTGTCVIEGPGRGAAAARNLGARLTSSEYLVWLDADDVLEREYFETAAARLDADSSLDFVSSALNAFGEASYPWKPSAPTFVEAMSTGGVPHASTLLRRSLWEALGGFDEDLPSFELLDFWATALERGARGLVLDEPFLRYRVRPGSAYRRSIQTETYLSRVRAVYARHSASVSAHAVELLQGKERFLHGQREYRRTLEARVAQIEGDLGRLRAEIERARQELEARRLPRFEWGDLRRARPVSARWGRERGTVVDRHYIQRFLDRHRAEIRGRVLEVRDSIYTQRFGGSRVVSSEVLDIDPSNPLATVVADLRRADTIPSSTYDCIILTHTLHLIDDMAAAIRHCARILRPGGVLLATVPSVNRVDDERGPDGDFWRLTEASARALFATAFPVDHFEVVPYGNVMACAALLYGLSVEDMAPADVDAVDHTFPVIVAIRAVKPTALAVTDQGASGSRRGARREPRPGAQRGVVLAYHRIARLTPDSHDLCTDPEQFRSHMQQVREHFRPIGLEDLIQAAAAADIPDRAVAVTFDDGYLDALTVASPILAELGVPATFFVNTDRLDEEHERWWDTLERLLLSDEPVPPGLSIRVGGEDLFLPTGTLLERREALTRLQLAAWPLDAGARAEMVGDVLTWHPSNVSPRPTHRVLTASEIGQLASRPGHAVGAHSTNHLALTTQPFETRQREVGESKATLERVLQRPVNLFAYPYGDIDGDTVKAVREARFHAAVTVEPGVLVPGTNRLLLPRFEIAAGRRGAFAGFLREMFNACLI
jgi:peptidoglycan/xylan/chitin deacetylase (PgdA/CDA1 family)/glycosyltransferase involved in cell wall biosynthesis